jgi:hypothetical protein
VQFWQGVLQSKPVKLKLQAQMQSVPHPKTFPFDEQEPPGTLSGVHSYV